MSLFYMLLNLKVQKHTAMQYAIFKFFFNVVLFLKSFNSQGGDELQMWTAEQVMWPASS